MHNQAGKVHNEAPVLAGVDVGDDVLVVHDEARLHGQGNMSLLKAKRIRAPTPGSSWTRHCIS